jgi:hypothetical protein
VETATLGIRELPRNELKERAIIIARIIADPSKTPDSINGLYFVSSGKMDQIHILGITLLEFFKQ